LCFMTVCMYRDIHTLQPYIIDFTQRGCHTLRLRFLCSDTKHQINVHGYCNLCLFADKEAKEKHK